MSQKNPDDEVASPPVDDSNSKKRSREGEGDDKDEDEDEGERRTKHVYSTIYFGMTVIL